MRVVGGVDNFLHFLLTVAVAFAGGVILYKLKFPAGAMVGALIGVGILSVLTGKAYMPSFMQNITKVVAGLFVGMSMNMEMIRGLKKIFKPAIILVVLIISLCFGMGVILYYAADLDVITSLFCVAPGGMIDMTLMTMDMGGDAAVVAVLQTLRLLTVYCISMPISKLLAKKFKGGGESEMRLSGKGDIEKSEKTRRIIFSFIVATVGGVAGYLVNLLVDFSVLVLIGAMVASAAANIKTGKLYMPKTVRTVVQMFSGALIGVKVTYESLLNIKAALIPAVFICVGFVIVNIVLAVVLNKTCRMNITTAMLSSSAGGATENALVAADFGADPGVVTVMQITRLICTTVFYPIVVKTMYQLL